jgi:hypothetical protein
VLLLSALEDACLQVIWKDLRKEGKDLEFHDQILAYGFASPPMAPLPLVSTAWSRVSAGLEGLLDADLLRMVR